MTETIRKLNKIRHLGAAMPRGKPLILNAFCMKIVVDLVPGT
jgi:hypothetical protein